MPSFEMLKKVNAAGRIRSVAVARRDLVREFRAFAEEPVDREVRRRRAVPVGQLVGLIAAVEARGQPLFALRRGLLGVQKILHLVPPALLVFFAAERLQIMQRAEKLREPRQFAIIGNGASLRRWRRRGGLGGIVRFLLALMDAFAEGAQRLEPALLRGRAIAA